MLPRPARSAQELVIALDLEPGWTIAAIGGGGKMDLLGRLAMAWAGLGGRALVSTTTRATDPRPTSAFETLIASAGAGQAEIEKMAMGRGGPGSVTFAARERGRVGVVEALDPETLAAVRARLRADLVLLKADGTRGQGLAAHAPGEPALPDLCHLLIGVAGIDVWGQPVGEESIHRAELFCEAWGYAPGEPIDDDAFIRTLSDPSGYRRFAPPRSRYVAVLDRVHGHELEEIAGRVALGIERAGVPVTWLE